MSYRSLSASILALGFVVPLAMTAPVLAGSSDEDCGINEVQDPGTLKCVPLNRADQQEDTQGFTVNKKVDGEIYDDFNDGPDKSETVPNN